MFEFIKAWKKLAIPLYLLLFTLVFGTLGYKIIYPEVPLLKLIFMTGITISTVGYGDVLGVENSPIALAYTMLLMLVGMGLVLYSISIVTAFILEGNLRHAFVVERIRRRVKHMENHFIICGAGETGIHVIREMFHTDQDFVVIESDESRRGKLNKEFPKCNVLIGDATSDQLLNQAGIDRCRGLVAALSSDKDNLYLVVTAKMINPHINIVARAINLSMIDKLKNAGAKYVVSPNFIGGMRMASEILRPNVVSFLDRMLRGKDKSIRVEEVTIPPSSPIIGETIDSAKIFDRCGINIIALGKKSNEFFYNPGPQTEISSGDVLLYIGNVEQEKRLEKLVHKGS